MENTSAVHQHEPWNKGKLIGQKTPLKLKEMWAIRFDWSCRTVFEILHFLI